MNKRYISNSFNLVVIFTGGVSLALVEAYKVLCCLHKLYITAVVQRRRNKNPGALNQRFQKPPVAFRVFLLVAIDLDIQISTSLR